MKVDHAARSSLILQPSSFNLHAFFEKFDLFADAPNAVAKMRALVLQLAVQGRLVSQSPYDEPADTLATTISEDRAAFVRTRSLARQRVFAPVAEGQCPFTLPSGWIWTRLGNLCRVQAGFAFESAAFVQGDSGVPMIRIRDITKDRTQVNFVGEYRKEFLVDAGDYLVGMDGNFTVAKWRGPRALLNQRVSRLQWYSQHLEPLFFAIAAQYRLSELQGAKAYTTVDHLSSGQIENAVVPLPPLAEQKRIVAKVDELMALCDRLEAQQQERETRHAALARASLARFADAPTPANLQFLFHSSYTIPPADLRKSILTLAVLGKLVPQDPNDQPVLSSFPKLASGTIEYESDDFPAYWLRVSLGKFGEWRGGGTPSKSRPDYWKGDIPWVSPKDMKVLHMADAQDHISPAAVENSSVRMIPPGSLLMVVRGMILARAFPVALTTRDLTINQDMKALLPFEAETRDFLLVALRAFDSEVLAAIEHSTHGTCKLNTEFLHRLTIPLPPLAEQRRIVAKVDQLMALVDQLEAQLVASRAIAANLLEALVAELTTQEESMKDEG